MTASPEPKRLLLIDDDEDLRMLFELSMKKEGFVVASAEDGVKGLAKVPVFNPHLIVLDLMMPLLDGFGVLRGLQTQGFGAIPVIVITGYSEKANAGLVSSEPNVVGFMQKPIKYGELVEKIRGLLA